MARVVSRSGVASYTNHADDGGTFFDVLRWRPPSPLHPPQDCDYKRVRGVYTPGAKEAKWKCWFDAWSAVEPCLGVLERKLLKENEAK